MKIFTCNSNKNLMGKITNDLEVSPGKSTVTTFKDGEICVRIEETVRGCDCFIIQSTSPPVNNNLMELLIMIDAMRRASARRITAVIPYFGYARQDRKTRSREPITAKLVANLLVTAGVNRILTMDLHCSQIQGFFDIPVDHLVGTPILVDYYKNAFEAGLENTVVVSPDVGGTRRARGFSRDLDIPLALVDKRRLEPNNLKAITINIIGDIKNKRVIIVDDFTDTAGTLCKVAEKLLENGATEVYACCTHAVLSGDAIEILQNSSIKELVVLDTVHLPMEKRIPKIKILSADGVFAEAICRIHNDEPLSDLYNKYMG